MDTKQANQQDHLESFLHKLDEYNDTFPRDKETYDSLRELEDDVLRKRLKLNKKELQVWKKNQNSFQTMTEKQQKNILVLCKALIVLKSLVNIYKESKDANILKKAQDIILKIKALDSNEHVFMSIRNELVLHINDAKQKAVKRVLKRVSGDLTSTREIAYASQSIMVMMGLITTTDIQEMKDVLEGVAFREFKKLVKNFKNSEQHGDYEIIKQVGASKITGAKSIPLHIKVVQAVKHLGGTKHINASEATNLATGLADIANDINKSASEKIRERSLLIDKELVDVQTEFEQGEMTNEQREEKLDSIKVIKAMAEAEILIKPSEKQTEIGKELGLTQEQEQAMLSVGKTIISAGAGSGKTRVLSAKVAHLLNDEDNDVSPFNIMAVSFSRKSAKDLQDKIKLNAGSKIPNIEVTALGKTTHSIAIEFINRFDPEATKTIVADKFMQDNLVKEAIKLASNTESGELEPEPDTFFGKKIDSLGGTNKQVDMRILNLLTSSQRWLEGRGFSKGVTVDLQRITKTYMESNEVSQKNIDEVNRILGYNRGWRAKLKAFGGDEKKAKNYTFPSYKGADKIASQNSANWWGIQELAGGGEKIPSIKACKLFITKAKSQMMTPQEAFDKVKASGAEYVIKAKIYGAYQHLLKEEGRMDFDDVLIKGVQVLNNATNLNQVQKQYKHIIVDEAQDLNPVQHAFFGLIAGTHKSGGRNQPPHELPADEQTMEGKSFTLVGDENQSIYGFRGATQKEFSSKAGKGGFTLKQIGINFRSGENIVNAANKLVEADSEDSLGLQCVASFKDQKDTIKHEIHDNVGKASRGVADHIKAMTDSEGTFTDSPSDFGIACRTNAEIIPYALALLEKGVPFKSGVNPFAHRSTKAIIRVLGFCTNDPSLQMSALYNFHKDLEMPISRFDGFMDKCKELLTDKVSDARTLAESVKTALVHWKQNKLENEDLVEFLQGEDDDDAKRIISIYFYLDMLLGLRQVGERTPVEAFDVALGYKPYTSSGSEKFIGNQEGKKLHEILGSYVSKSDTSSLSPIGEQDIDSEVEGEAEDQEEMSSSEQEEWNLAPLPALRQMFLKADKNKGGFYKIFDKISEMKRNADSQGLVKDDDDVVVLDTVHGWKGLEVKNLYVPMVEGTFPSSRSTFDPLIHESQEEAEAERLDQEKKLAYVAITRGMSNVNILSYKTSTAGKEVEPSQFISQMGVCPTSNKSASQRRLATALDILSEYSASEDDDMTDAEFEEATRGL
jgi:superfamily I DNA/RNA helicase